MGTRDYNIRVDNKILATLMKDTQKVFEVNDVLISEDDFCRDSTQCIYSAIVRLAAKHKRIDPLILDSTIKQHYPFEYKKHGSYLLKRIKKMIKMRPVENISQYTQIVVNSAIKQRAVDHLEDLKYDILQIDDHNELINHLVDKTAAFTSAQLKAPDVVHMREYFREFIAEKKQMLAEGGSVGILTGYDLYDEAIGGGHRRGAIDVVAARGKAGKSIYALNKTAHVAQTIPVLYLDTELNKSIQMTRLLSIMSGVSIRAMDRGKFLKKPGMKKKIKKAREAIKSLNFDYQSIKGWSMAKQVSFIRSWFARHVGRDERGKTKEAFVILDYLKIMDFDGGKNVREWEAIGHQLSTLHDLVNQLDTTMLCMAQQNRAGIEEDHEGTVAGSDRIAWFCDSLSFLRKRRYEDLEEAYEDREDINQEQFNMIMKVKLSRFGDGSSDGEFIGMYADIHNPFQSKFKKNAIMEEWGIERIFSNKKKKD